jgi:hypothetical protein
MSEPQVEVDLTTDPLEDIQPTTKKEPYDPTKDRETARKTIALTLIWTLIGVLVVSFSILGFSCGAKDANESLMKLLTLVFTPLVALVGSAVGFYFGAQPSKG